MLRRLKFIDWILDFLDLRKERKKDWLNDSWSVNLLEGLWVLCGYPARFFLEFWWRICLWVFGFCDLGVKPIFLVVWNFYCLTLILGAVFMGEREKKLKWNYLCLSCWANEEGIFESGLVIFFSFFQSDKQKNEASLVFWKLEAFRNQKCNGVCFLN